MKNAPDKIYLQIDADGETPEDFKDLAGVSWCEDKIHNNDIEYVLKSPVEAAAKEVGEWQLCPKCHGDGNLFRYNSPAIMGTNSTPICDVCNGNKIIQKPYLQSNPGEQGQEEAWLEMFDELTQICIGAPIHEPDRVHYIIKKLKERYHLIKKQP